ncbi:MAG: hypothetical protein A3B70_01790 [Deltaproteobacteria bacterium RIFCSPHIGHO2_02_FULL_40_11]|nr:MAG: hypothetical protein A3B70_01790 [Deltaproteobacteria bacterium RIFCSPHIGHO2_02_FULL_40_11]
MKNRIKHLLFSGVFFLCLGVGYSAQAGLADIFVEIYDQVKSGAIEPAYDSIKGYIVEKKLLSFLDSIELGDPELEAKYRNLITSSEFDETYFPFFLSMLDQVGVVQEFLKDANDKANGDAASFLADPEKKTYLRTILLVFGKLFLYRNGADVAAEELHAQVLKLSKNPNLPEFIQTRLSKILEDPQASMDLYHFIGTLVQSIGKDYLHDFMERETLRKAKLQWLEAAGLEKVIEYFEASLTKKRAVMIMVDGVGGQYLEDLLKAGHPYPTLQTLHDQSAWVKRSSASTPTISTRNIAILETGISVADLEVKGEQASTDIPNFTYVDRQKQEWMYFWGRDGIRLRELVKEAGAKTIFESLAPYQTVSFLAQFDTAANDRFSYFLGEVMWQLKPGLAEAIGLSNLNQRTKTETALNEKRLKLIRYLKRNRELWANKILWTDRHYLNIAHEILSEEDRGLPDFLLWYNPWVDHKSHEFGPNHPEVLEKHMVKFDQDVGQILSMYQAAGVFERTLFGMVSDHGQVTVDLPKGNVHLEKTVIDPLTQNWKKISSDEGGPPKIDRMKSSVLGYDVVFGSTAGGSFVMDLFYKDAYEKDGKTVRDAKRWAAHPRYADLRNYELMDGRRVDWISQIKRELKGYLDTALVRDDLPKDKPEIDQIVRVIAPVGEARVVRKFKKEIFEKLKQDPNYRYSLDFKKKKFDRYVYKYEIVEDTVTGKVEGDPLRLGQQNPEIQDWIDAGSWQTDREWLEATAKVDRLDAIHEISHLYDSHLAGTINLFPAKEKGFNTGVPGRHAGELFEEKNALQLYYGAMVSPKGIPVARGGSMPVTMIHYLLGDRYFTPLRYDFDFESLLGELD